MTSGANHRFNGSGCGNHQSQVAGLCLSLSVLRGDLLCRCYPSTSQQNHLKLNNAPTVFLNHEPPFNTFGLSHDDSAMWNDAVQMSQDTSQKKSEVCNYNVKW